MSVERFKTRYWIKIVFLNFVIVSLAGLLMRYKINFSIPIIDQKNLMQGHAHFAFIGWITMALIILLVHYLIQHQVNTNYQKYHLILVAHLMVAYAMLISFTLEGYGALSIILSTATILLSYLFIYFYLKDLKKVPGRLKSKKWFKAALCLWAFSSLGPFSLAYLMACHISNQDLYVLSIYMYLHFQYNGWFLFAILGCLFGFIEKQTNNLGVSSMQPRADFWGIQLYKWMVITIIPSYFLSTLWLNLPRVIVWLANLTALLQISVIICIIQWVRKLPTKIWSPLKPQIRMFWLFGLTALIIKIALQSLSVIPYFTHYAFGFRPIVIGYLHLVFIGILSFFIMGALLNLPIISQIRYKKSGLVLFITGFILQEIILMLQGFEAFNQTSMPRASILLFYCAIFMVSGLAMIAHGLFYGRPIKKIPVVSMKVIYKPKG